MDFKLSPDQSALQDSLRRYFADTYTLEVRRALVERANSRDPAFWRTYAEMGWIGAALPEDVGGLGLGLTESMLILQEAGRAMAVEPLLPVVVAAALLNAHGSAEQRESVLPGIAEGTCVLVLAHGEHDALACNLSATLEAVPGRSGGHVLDGRKAVVVGGPLADHFIVSARTAYGTSLFLVNANSPGIRRHDYALVDGRLASDLAIEALEVPDTCLVGELNRGSKLLSSALDHAKVGACAQAVGAMDLALEMTRDYAKTRKQFGQEIGKFQALQHRMADMYIELEQARSMFYRGLAALEHGTQAAQRSAQVASAKAQVGFAARFVGGNAIQLHGGIGMTNEYAVGHCFKFLTVTDALLGNADEQLALVASTLGEEFVLD